MTQFSDEFLYALLIIDCLNFSGFWSALEALIKFLRTGQRVPNDLTMSFGSLLINTGCLLSFTGWPRIHSSIVELFMAFSLPTMILIGTNVKRRLALYTFLCFFGISFLAFSTNEDRQFYGDVLNFICGFLATRYNVGIFFFGEKVSGYYALLQFRFLFGSSGWGYFAYVIGGIGSPFFIAMSVFSINSILVILFYFIRGAPKTAKIEPEKASNASQHKAKGKTKGKGKGKHLKSD